MVYPARFYTVRTCTMVNKRVIEGEDLLEGSQNSVVMTTELKEKKNYSVNISN